MLKTTQLKCVKITVVTNILVVTKILVDIFETNKYLLQGLWKLQKN